MLNRTSIVAVSMSTLAIAGTETAFADDIWGGVDCNKVDYAGCDLGVGQRQVQPSWPQQSGNGGQTGGSGSAGSRDRWRGDQIAEPPNLANCRYVRSNYRPPTSGTKSIGYHPPDDGGAITVVPAMYQPSRSDGAVRHAQRQPSQGRSGAWYVYRCSGEGWSDALYRPPIWIPDDAGRGPSPVQLAQQAYDQLRLPSPQVHASPAEIQLVNLPTWLWLDRDQWRPQTATASVPGVSITATATPQSVTWSMGDGSTVTCQGAGTPFRPGSNPKAASPDCGHTYRQSSQGQPNDTFPVAATVRWTVRWSGAGQSGTLPGLTTTSTASFAVAESQALNNAPR